MITGYSHSDRHNQQRTASWLRCQRAFAEGFARLQDPQPEDFSARGLRADQKPRGHRGALRAAMRSRNTNRYLRYRHVLGSHSVIVRSSSFEACQRPSALMR